MSLEKKIIEHTKYHKKLYLPYLWEEWGVKPEDFTEALCNVWWKFDNPRMVDNLLHTNATNEPNLYEVCDKRWNRGKTVHKKNLWKYCTSNQKEDQHISVFSHGRTWKKNYENTGSVSCNDTTVGIDYVYLELDREHLRKAVKDAIQFYLDFPYKEYCELWYSGNKSVHISIDSSLFGKPMGRQKNMCGRGKLAYNLAHKLCGDLRWGNGIADPWTMRTDELKDVYEDQFGEKADHISKHDLKQTLENIDPNLFTTNSLIRQPYSIHETGKARKIEIPINELIFGMEPPPKKEFDIDSKNNYIIDSRRPYLLHWFYDCFKVKKQASHYIPDVDEDEIIKTYANVFDYFDPDDADPNGWVNGLYSPFYEDTNNSVSVNIETGWYYDFGYLDHNMNFKQFKEKWKKLQEKK